MLPNHTSHVAIASVKADWPFAATILPAPPQQGQAIADARMEGLSPSLVRAASALFAQGAADPRGLPYREVEILQMTQIEGPATRVATKAFVLPGREGERRFGIAWNGLVYPLLSVGPEASLEADIAALGKSDKALCERMTAELAMPCLRLMGPRAEIRSYGLEEILPMHIAMLVQLGKDELAKALWLSWIEHGTPSDMPEVSGKEAAIYARLATHFLAVLRDRALWAHVRGEDDLALASLRGLSRMIPTVVAHATKLGVDEGMMRELGAPVGPLLADQEVRAQAPSKGIPASLPADPAARVRVLVAALSEVHEHALGRYGSQSQVLGDPLLKALLAEGKVAVEPLVDALLHDERLTRSMWYQEHGVVLFSVRDVADLALDALGKDLPLSKAPEGETREQKAARFLAAVRK